MAKSNRTDESSPPKCPISEADFLKYAKPLTITIKSAEGECTLVASPRAFKTGSFGYFVVEKGLTIVNGIPVRLQIGSLTAIGSNPNKVKK